MTLKQTLKKAYSILPYKKQLFQFVKYFGVPKSSIYQHLYFTGPMKVKVDKQKDFKMIHTGHIEENEIFWNGLKNGWEKKSVALWSKLCENCSEIVDVGANTGLYSLVASAVNPKANVRAFEPIKGVFSILKKNIYLNNSNIKSYEIALSDYIGTGKIYMEKGASFAYSVTVNQKTISVPCDEIEINVTQLKKIIEEESIPNIDLMKIDVETHEYEVLIGMGEYLKKFKPTLLIEMLNDEVAQNVNTLLNSIDYLYFNIDDENNSIRQMDKLYKSDHWNFLVCNERVAKSLNLISCKN